MTDQPYDPVGAMGGLFAPAYIHGNPEAEAAVSKWQAENFALTPAMVEATRGPSTTVQNPLSPMGARGLSGIGSTTTIPGSVDPAALKIMAQGGKYKGVIPAGGGGGSGSSAAAVPAAASAQRDAITGAILGAGRIPNATAGSLIAPRTGAMPPGMQQAWSPLIGLMGEGDNQGFMQGSFAGGA